MAQPGNFTPLLLYSSSTPTNVPLATNLINSTIGAELAINIADKNLFFKDSGGTVNNHQYCSRIINGKYVIRQQL